MQHFNSLAFVEVYSWVLDGFFLLNLVTKISTNFLFVAASGADDVERRVIWITDVEIIIG